MGLKGITPALALSYRTGRDDLVTDFFVPCLEQSVLYRRAAGYFTSSGLTVAARGVASLASRGGRMRLVVSPRLEPDDVEALNRAHENREDVLRCIVSRDLTEIEDAILRERLNALAWLAASGLLQVRIALRLDTDGRISSGLFHEKMGIFSDAEGDHVTFSGSANETAGGLVENFESIKVFRSWRDPEGRVTEEIENFESLWKNTTPGLCVIEFTDVSSEILERFRDPEDSRFKEEPVEFPAQRKPTIPKGFELRSPQRDALNAWKENDFKGILAMATGSGKTLTAIYGAVKVSEKLDAVVLIIVSPYINLAEQWCRELARFRIHPVRCYRTRRSWQSALQNGLTALALQRSDFLAIAVTNRTFLSDAFQSELRPDQFPHILIADEVHNLGASKIKALLPPAVRFRLGLSATPERHRDETGTAAIFDYFGGVVFEYGIRQAIKDGILCPYLYHPVLVDLTDAEGEEYWDLTKEIGRRFSRDGDGEEMPVALQMLLIRRARLLSSAASKLPRLSDVFDQLGDKPEKALIYCGDGRVEDDAASDESLARQVDAAVRLAGITHGLSVRRFTCSEPMEEREAILAQLRDGALDAVVAIRCLDEGIDVPDVRTAFILASSTNPRQFIQRRGRLLRKAPGKTLATIWDFIVRPPDLGGRVDDTTFNIERKLFARELARVVEFCQTAENGSQALGLLADLRRRYNLVAT